ncbi:MAG: CHASE3 domain-containing protein, partial [Acidimicrobiia bacterium]
MDPGERRPPVSLVATIVAWTRATMIASGIIAVVIAGLLVVNRGVYEPRVEHAIDAATAVRKAHEAMLDQETGLRGFLVSGDERFLKPYERGTQNVERFNAEAAGLLAGVGEAGQLLLDMRLAQQSWARGWADEALERGQDAGRATSDAFLAQGRRLFDAYRRTYEALVTRLVARRQDALRAQSNALLVVAGLAGLGTAAFGSVAVRRGRALRRAVGQPLTEILERLERIEAGDFSTQPPLRGPAELEVVAAGLDTTAAALAGARSRSEEQAAQLAARARQLSQVLRLAREVAGSLNLRYVLRGVCTAAAAISDGARVVVWLRDDGGQQVEA